jgi:hypothetical protein
MVTSSCVPSNQSEGQMGCFPARVNDSVWSIQATNRERASQDSDSPPRSIVPPLVSHSAVRSFPSSEYEWKIRPRPDKTASPDPVRVARDELREDELIAARLQKRRYLDSLQLDHPVPILSEEVHVSRDAVCIELGNGSV